MLTGPMAGKEDPSIAVVIPAYNVAEWIGETLDSVLAQSSPPDEIIVVDDGSSDDIDSALASYGHAITFIRQSNAGCGAAFNTAIEAARHEFVALCPADDVWDPDKLSWQRATLRNHPDVDVSFTAAVNFGVSDAPAPRPSTPGTQDRERFVREMFVQNVIPDPSVVLRRSLHRSLGGFVAAIGEDYEFWLRAITANATFHFDPRTTVRLRQRRTNLSANAAAIWRMNAEVHAAHAAALDDEVLANAVLARDFRRLARAYAGLGALKDASTAYANAYSYGGHRGDRLRALFAGLPGLEPTARAAYRVRRATSS